MLFLKEIVTLSGVILSFTLNRNSKKNRSGKIMIGWIKKSTDDICSDKNDTRLYQYDSISLSPQNVLN